MEAEAEFSPAQPNSQGVWVFTDQNGRIVAQQECGGYIEAVKYASAFSQAAVACDRTDNVVRYAIGPSGMRVAIRHAGRG